VDPKQSIIRSQFRLFGISIKDGELLAQSEVFCHEFKARRKEQSEKGKESREEAHENKQLGE
jgi:hypothetical protein